MKVAVASSGLGHVTRGVETWALDTAMALRHHGVDVSLFAGAPLENIPLPVIVIPCLRRNQMLTKAITRFAPKPAWRWNLKSTYAIEQSTYWFLLKKHLIQGRYDILHVQDPLLAAYAQKSYQAGKIPCACILAHGTEEAANYLTQFPYLQHLAPWHMQQTLAALADDHAPTSPQQYPGWTVLPNFVDTERFHPVQNASMQQQLRRQFHLPEKAIIWGTAAAIKSHHKRVDWLISEFAASAAKQDNLHLVIAGSQQNDTAALMAKARACCPGRITFMINHPHHAMPELLQTLDAFVLTSLFEMMPIAILEAISTGLPVITHHHPVLSWMAGSGGQQIPMDVPGALSRTITQLERTTLRTIGEKAREHAIATFSVEQVIPAYIRYYNHITSRTRNGS